MSTLLDEGCVPVVRVLTDAECASLLLQVPGWAVSEARLTRTYRFKDYHQTLAFVNAVAWVAHTEDHHPELVVGYNRCEVRYDTHSVGGVSRNDFICAAKVDALVHGPDGSCRLPG